MDQTNNAKCLTMYYTLFLIKTCWNVLRAENIPFIISTYKNTPKDKPPSSPTPSTCQGRGQGKAQPSDPIIPPLLSRWLGIPSHAKMQEPDGESNGWHLQHHPSNLSTLSTRSPTASASLRSKREGREERTSPKSCAWRSALRVLRPPERMKRGNFQLRQSETQLRVMFSE